MAGEPRPATKTSLHQPPHHLAGPALVHGQAHQFAHRIQHFPEPALLLLPDRVVGQLLSLTFFPARPRVDRAPRRAQIIAELQNRFGYKQVHRQFVLGDVPGDLDGSHGKSLERSKARRQHLKQPSPDEASVPFLVSVRISLLLPVCNDASIALQC